VVQQGSLYPALQRMRRRGWIRSEWRITENNRRARYYALTAAGQRQLGIERAAWDRAAAAINAVLGGWAVASGGTAVRPSPQPA
jgi:DNA-binding PadR family transcriptional regulator